MSCNNICTCIFFSSSLINAQASKLLAAANGEKTASQVRFNRRVFNCIGHCIGSALWQVKWNFLMHIYEAHTYRPTALACAPKLKKTEFVLNMAECVRDLRRVGHSIWKFMHSDFLRKSIALIKSGWECAEREQRQTNSLQLKGCEGIWI